MNKTPFFSIVIIGHGEAKNMTRSFESILNQNGFAFLYDDIQVVYCDDCSEGMEDRLTLMRSYHSKLHITECNVNDHGGECKNPKQVGLLEAIGKWITFLDCNDVFTDNALLEVRKHAETFNTHMVQGNTNAYLENSSNFLRTIVPGSIMTDCTIYGKFFSAEFIDKHHIEFKNSYEFYEDTHFLSQVTAASIRDNIICFCINDVIYHRIYDVNPFPAMASINARSVVERHLKEFMETAEPYFREYRHTFKEYHTELLKSKIIQVLLNVYLYYQYALFKEGNYILSENLSYMHDFVHRICYRLEIDETSIINYIYKNPRLYLDTRNEIVDLFGNFIESQSIRDFVLNI